MGAIKRNITDISNLKRGDVQISKVYRGTTVIWTGGVVPPEPYSIESFEPSSLGYNKIVNGVAQESFKAGILGYEIA